MTKQYHSPDLGKYSGRISKHPAYSVWAKMRQRCYNPKNDSFSDYGARGIYVCDDWRFSPLPFILWAIKAGYRPGLQLDRKNNYGPYSPSNCRFVTCAINNQNKRNNLILSDGSLACLAARAAGISKVTYHSRIKRGWSVDDAVSIPVRARRSVVVKKGAS